VSKVRDCVVCLLSEMAQWQTLSKLCQQDGRVQQRVVELYRRINFPYKFRSHFATWIEEQDWFVDSHSLLYIVNKDPLLSNIFCN